MSIDADTGDLPKIYGEGNLDAVDIVVDSDGTLDMQGGTMKNFLLSGSKAGQLVAQNGGEIKLSDGAYLTSSDLSASGSNDYPLFTLMAVSLLSVHLQLLPVQEISVMVLNLSTPEN